MSAHRLLPPSPRGRRGFTLIEMMVALAVGLVMVFGFAVMFVNMKSTFKTQDSLGTLQDGERLAMTVLTSAVQQAGYYPTPLTASRSDQILATTDTDYGTWVAGRQIYGTAASASLNESLQTAFATATGDGLLNCLGGTNTGTGNLTYRNVFTVDSAHGTLKCKVLSTANGSSTTDSGWQDIVANVKSMSVLYGVDSNADGALDEYMPVGSMTSTLWDNVKAVRVTLVLVNDAALDKSANTVTWTTTINLMNDQ